MTGRNKCGRNSEKVNNFTWSILLLLKCGNQGLHVQFPLLIFNKNAENEAVEKTRVGKLNQHDIKKKKRKTKLNTDVEQIQMLPGNFHVW